GRPGLVFGTLAAAAVAAAVGWRLTHLPPPTAATTVAAAAAAPAPRPAMPAPAEDLPPLPAGMSPAKVWVVEKGNGYEQYSNGLRVDTTFAAVGDPRQYRVFTETGGMGATLE